MGLKIKSIKAELVELGLKKPYAIAYRTITTVEVLFVRVEAWNGMTGLGAANTNGMLFTGNNGEALREFTGEACHVFTGREFGDLAEGTGLILREFKTAGARAAMDIAFHDLYAKHSGIPLVTCLGQKHRSMLTSVTIGIMDIEETLREAREFIRGGFKILKVKLGTTVEEDIERIKALRAAVPPGIKIRVDANQGWGCEDTITFFRETRPVDIELVEQPVPVEAADLMRSFPGEMKGLIAVDESLYTPEDAEYLAGEPGAAGIFNIKLMKCGGICRAREISAIAEKSGIALMWGCNDESAVSISAALHTALSRPGTRYLDLDGSFDLDRDVVKGGFVLKDGALSVTGKPGLGVESL